MIWTFPFLGLWILFPVVELIRNESCSCGIERTKSKIIGGIDAEKNRYPWMVGVVTSLSKRNTYAFCGGSIINDRFILTAAHCVNNVTLSRAKVVVGAHTLQDVVTLPSYSVSEIITEEYPSSGLKNDFALLKLSKNLSFANDSLARPICLTSESGPYDNLFLTGWGKTNHSQFSQVMQEIHLDPIDDLTCSKKWPMFNSSRQLCAGESGRSACKGDSGGPLSTRVNGRVFEVGIVSYGDQRCASGTGTPTVYTKVSSYYQTIHSNVKLHDSLDGIQSLWCNSS